jgi:hypothetical protein
LELVLGVLPWANVSINGGSEYPVNHLLHPANQYRASVKLEQREY